MNLGFQMGDETLDLLSQPFDSLTAYDLGVDDGSDAADRMVQIVVHDNVLVLIDCLHFVQGGM